MWINRLKFYLINLTKSFLFKMLTYKIEFIFIQIDGIKKINKFSKIQILENCSMFMRMYELYNYYIYLIVIILIYVCKHILNMY